MSVDKRTPVKKSTPVDKNTSIENLITDHIDIWTSAIKQKSATGRGSNKKIELYGIKKLRELILELAVRGKLVPQDPNDEPASVLLERIAEEKAQLLSSQGKDGKIKKSKKLPEITEDEKPFELPEGWEWSLLGNVYELEYGNNLPQAKRSNSGEYPVYGSNGIVGTHNEYCVGQPCIIIGRKGSAGALNLESGQGCWVTDVAYSVIPSTSLLLRFVFIQLHTLGLDFLGKGIKPGLNRNDAYQLCLAFPPRAEQHRIVAKVDELMALCDELEAQTESSLDAHQTLVTVLLNTLVNSQDADELAENWTRLSDHFDTLFTTEHSIDQLKQTVLQLAVMGKLVPQDPNDEPASVLLERIAAEKEQLIKDKKIKKQKPLPPITDDEKPFQLPKGWEWVRFGSVVICRLGKMLDKAKNTGTLLPYLRNTNVQWGRFILDDIKLMKLEESELQEFRILPGDLLICEGGEPGRCAIWTEAELEMYFQKALHRARPLAGIQSKYLQLSLTVDAKTGVLDNYFTGATIKHFVGTKLNNYIHSLPPLEEQHRIVAKVGELMALCDQLKTRLNDAQTTQRQLADALTEQAL
ncbi:restriction endonuclease subunit S [Marinomonas arenicola]|uniref:restriction endonuclease subunit S n=1 Tax=Marinomonas arenicola TaxID=569601 RepID=UPI00311F2B56